MPSFTLMSGDIRLAFDPENFQLAIAGRIRAQALSVVLEAMDAAGKRVIFVSENLSTLQTVRDRWPKILALRQQEGWLDTLMLVARRIPVSASARKLAPTAPNMPMPPRRAKPLWDATCWRCVTPSTMR